VGQVILTNKHAKDEIQNSDPLSGFCVYSAFSLQ